MKDMMEKMKMMKDGDEEKDYKKMAHMQVLKDLRQMAMDAMGEGMSDMKKVTVAADDDEGLEEGLKKAKEMLGKK